MALFGSSVFRRMMDFHGRFYGWIALICVAVAVTGASFAIHLRMNTDLESLLPKKAASVVAMNVLKPKSGGAQDFRLVLSGSTPEKRLQMAQGFSDLLKQKDWASSVRYRTPKDFLDDKKLFLIPMNSLNSLHATILRERGEHRDIVDPFGLEEPAETKDDAQAVGQDTGQDHVRSEAEKARDDESLDQAKQFLADLEEMRPLYETEDRAFLILRIVPKAASYNISDNKVLLEELWSFVRDYQSSHDAQDIQPDIIGSLWSQIQKYESIANDVSMGALGILLILLVLVIYFRNFLCLVALIPPLLMGLTVGAGIAQYFEGRLNTIAAFLVMVIFGIGVEFGIHLWARYLEERKNAEPLEALRLTWQYTGLATVTSSTALLAGFALLTVSSFQGFAQFGRVAIILVIVVAGSFVVLMPSWILVAEKLRGQKPWPESLAPQIGAFLTQSLRSPGSLRFRRGLSIFLGIAAIIVCGWKLRFDYNFEDKVQDSKRSVAQVANASVFTERLKPSAMAVFSTADEAFRFVEFYRQRKESYPDIDLVSGLDTFFSPDLPQRIEKLKAISDDLEGWWIKRLDDERLRKALYELQERAPNLTPYSLDEVPSEVVEPFQASDGSGDHLVFLYDVGGETDGRKSIRFSQAVERLKRDFGANPVISGPEIILADIVTRVINEGPWLLLGMLALVTLICWFDFKDLKLTAITLAPVLYGFLLTGLVILAGGIKINFYNMVAWASLASMVIDNSIHLFHRFLELRQNQEGAASLLATARVAPTIMLCTLTSIFGYGGMAVADHTGISSLGWVAVLGLASCMISAIVFFPAWLALSDRSKAV